MSSITSLLIVFIGNLIFNLDDSAALYLLHIVNSISSIVLVVDISFDVHNLKANSFFHIVFSLNDPLFKTYLPDQSGQLRY